MRSLPPCKVAVLEKRRRPLDERRAADFRPWRDRRGRAVQILDRETGGGLVARHEFGALLFRDDIVDVVERAAAALIDHIEQRERARAAIAQDKLRDRAAQFRVEGRERLRRDAMLDHTSAENARI